MIPVTSNKSWRTPRTSWRKNLYLFRASRPNSLSTTQPRTLSSHACSVSSVIFSKTASRWRQKRNLTKDRHAPCIEHIVIQIEIVVPTPRSYANVCVGVLPMYALRHASQSLKVYTCVCIYIYIYTCNVPHFDFR